MLENTVSTEMVKELEAAKERELIKTKEPAIIKNNDEKNCGKVIMERAEGARGD